MNPILTLRRLLFAACLFISFSVQAQTKAIAFVKRYPVQQQRLLTIVTQQYLYAINQGQLDADSAMLYSCRRYGVSRLLPYNEAYYHIGSSKAEALLNAGRVTEAVALQTQLKGEALLRLWCELSAYYLSKPGFQKNDMDSALLFIQKAVTAAEAAQACVWQGESHRLLGRYYYAARDSIASAKAFERAEKVLQACNNKYGVALTWQQRGECLPYNSPDKLKYLRQAQDLFHQLVFRENEIEVVSDLVGIYMRGDVVAAEKELNHVLQIEAAIGFKHVMHANDVLAFLIQMKADYIAAMAHTEKAIKSIEETGDSTLFSYVYGRKALVYGNMKKKDETIHAYRLIVDRRHSFPEIFWYKHFLGLASYLSYIDRPAEALALVDSVTAEFPPATEYNIVNLKVIRGYCYHFLGRLREAAEQFNAFDVMASRFPPEFTYIELSEGYYQGAYFFCDIKDYKRARYFLQKAMRFPLSSKNIAGRYRMEGMQFRLDSATGDYHSALLHFIKYKALSDSMSNLAQREQLDEMLVKYASEKKEKDITVLKQQASLNQAQIKQSNLVKNVTLAGILLLLIITALLFNRYRTRQRTSQQLEAKNVALQHLVDEKEWLVKEIHHRVKNNLQTIVSLLESQSAYLQDDALLALQDSQNRVYAMSLIHQKLYQTERMVSIGMDRYLPELVAHLKDSFSIGESITFMQQIDEIEIDVSQAIPVGLILNEAITNAIKYAFSESSASREIHIAMHRLTNNSIELVIRDNGKGLPPDFDSNRINSLGMRLMKGLTEDINGEFTLESKNGVYISVVFRPNAILNN